MMGEKTQKIDGRKYNGGARPGSGRKSEGKEPKRPPGVRVSAAAIHHLNMLYESADEEIKVSKAIIVEYALLRLKKVPKNIRQILKELEQGS